MAAVTKSKVTQLEAPDYLDTDEAEKFRELVSMLND